MRTLRQAWIALAAAALVPTLAHAQKARPCDPGETVIESSHSVLVLCKALDPAPSLPTTAELYEVQPTAAGDPTVAPVKVADLTVAGVVGPTGPVPWYRFTLPPNVSLTVPKRYYLHFPVSLPPSPPPGDAWKPFWHAVATEVETVIVDEAASYDSGKILRVRTPAALMPAPSAKVFLKENGSWHPLEGTIAVSVPAPAGASVDPTYLGNATITLRTRLPASKVKLKIEHLTNVLGQNASPPEKARTEILGRKLSGKTKDEVGTYLKFSHEAAGDTKPAYTLDAKVEIEVPTLLHGFRVIPTFAADVGLGTSKSTNVVKLGVGFTRFDLLGKFRNPADDETPPPRDKRLLQGIRLTITPGVETNRDFSKENLLVDVDTQFFFKKLYNPIARRNRATLVALRRSTPDAQLEDITSAKVGWVVAVKAGAELGGALLDEEKTFETGEGAAKTSTTVTAAAFGIGRPKVAASVLLELTRLSFQVTGTGRYLTTTERAILEEPKGVFSVASFDGWQGYGEATLSLKLTDRTSLDSTYKVGRQPPSYQRVSTVQTGIALKF